MRNEKNIEQLAAQLATLGFAGEQAYNLRSNICFHPESFDLPYRLSKDRDVINFSICFQQNKGLGYECLYYDACLRKQIPFTDLAAGNVDIGGLQKRMAAIDWMSFDKTLKSGLADITDNVERAIGELQALGQTEEGKKTAGLLKYMCWSDTALEYLIPGLSSFKSQYEISQRFYLFEGDPGITAEEAYRFLCNKWMEKKVQAKKKKP